MEVIVNTQLLPSMEGTHTHPSWPSPLQTFSIIQATPLNVLYNVSLSVYITSSFDMKTVLMTCCCRIPIVPCMHVSEM